MKSKTVILLVVAGVCGLVASYMTSRYLASQNEKVTVLVAKQKIAGSTALKEPEQLFDIDERPRNEVPKNAVVSMDNLKDQVLNKPLEKGDILSSENLVEKGKAGLDSTIPPGYRAVGVRTTQEAIVGGFVLPGSHVDVIHTARGNDKDVKGQMILQNILVLAVDQKNDQQGDRVAVLSTTVSVLVTPEEAQVLAAAQTTGVITFSLRSRQDESTVVVDKPKPKEPEPEPKEEKPEPKPVEVVEQPKEPPALVQRLTIINGSATSVTTYTTKNGETQVSTERSGPEVTLPSLPPAPPPAKDKDHDAGSK